MEPALGNDPASIRLIRRSTFINKRNTVALGKSSQEEKVIYQTTIKMRNIHHIFYQFADSLHEEQEKERRERRARRSVTNDASKTYDTCQLALVADHLFFEHMGQRKRSTAINYMVCFKISTFQKFSRTLT